MYKCTRLDKTHQNRNYLLNTMKLAFLSLTTIALTFYGAHALKVKLPDPGFSDCSIGSYHFPRIMKIW